jgi:hypothetical protein
VLTLSLKIHKFSTKKKKCSRKEIQLYLKVQELKKKKNGPCVDKMEKIGFVLRNELKEIWPHVNEKIWLHVQGNGKEIWPHVKEH